MGIKQGYTSLHSRTVHSTPYYISIHATIFLMETAIMGLMGWIMSPDTQGQLTGGDDATGNMPGFVFLFTFFSWINSIAVIGLWLVDAYNPPVLRASIQAFLLLPANAVVGALLAYQNNWTVFLGTCTAGSVLCKSIWITVVRVEGIAVLLLLLVIMFTLVDTVAALRMWRAQRVALRRLVGITTIKRYSYPSVPSTPR